jgi:acyl-CoA thioesterase FadM
MTQEALNIKMLPGNACYGCGHDNPEGLKIEVYRDEERPDRLAGSFHPPRHMVGFPGITHGGGLYTALDCMAAWTPTVLRPDTKAMWILRSATIKYLAPALQGEPLRLYATIEEEGDTWAPMTVRTEVRDGEGKILAEGSFKVIPLPPEKFKRIAGVDALPENWAALIEQPER